MISLYVEDLDGSVRKVDPAEWSLDRRWHHVSTLTLGNEEIRVSTVFLGIDHNFTGEGPPLLYETIVFGGDLDQSQRRYCTREEAVKGHEEVVQEIINTRSLPQCQGLFYTKDRKDSQ